MWPTYYPIEAQSSLCQIGASIGLLNLYYISFNYPVPDANESLSVNN